MNQTPGELALPAFLQRKQAMKTKIFAHRGVRKYHAENTMAAFQAAEAMGLEGIELDVQRTADGQLVICHDENLLKLTGRDVWLKDLTYSQLEELNVADYRPDSPAQQAPLLSTFLDWFKGTSLVVNLELKNTVIPYPGMEEEVIQMVRHYQVTDRVILSSFSLDSVALAKRLAPEIDVGFLYQKFQPSVVNKARKLNLDAIHPLFVNQLWPWLTWQAHRRGLKVRVWTVDHPFFIRNALRRKVDTIMTDDPELVLRLRQEGG